MTFQVGNSVRVSEDAKYGLEYTRYRFEAAERLGVVEDTGDMLLHGGEYIVVYTPDRTAWEYFTPAELELIEGSDHD